MAAPSGFMTTDTDNFNYNGNITVGHGWTKNGVGGAEFYGSVGPPPYCYLVGNKGYVASADRDLAETDVADCYGGFIISAQDFTNASVNWCIQLRRAHDHTVADGDFYLGDPRGPTTYILKHIGATWTTLASAASVGWATNDVCTFSVKGAEKRLYRNGTEVLSELADTARTTGRAGMRAQDAAGSSPDIKRTNWEYGVPLESNPALCRIRSPQLRRDHPRFREV